MRDSVGQWTLEVYKLQRETPVAKGPNTSRVLCGDDNPPQSDLYATV